MFMFASLTYFCFPFFFLATCNALDVTHIHSCLSYKRIIMKIIGEELQ